MRIKGLFFGFLLCLIVFQELLGFIPLTFAESQAQSPIASPVVSKEYRLGANDVIEISVYGEDDLTQEVRVTNSGYITYPLLGRVKVLGMSIVEVEDFVREALAKDYIRDPQVRVFVKEFTNIYVLGQVKQPGPYPFKGGVTVLQGITMAGGFTKIANQRKVRIVRSVNGKRNVIDANMSSISKGSREDIALQPGDSVVVPESFF